MIFIQAASLPWSNLDRSTMAQTCKLETGTYTESLIDPEISWFPVTTCVESTFSYNPTYGNLSNKFNQPSFKE